jgi:hypothetical protein
MLVGKDSTNFIIGTRIGQDGMPVDDDDDDDEMDQDANQDAKTVKSGNWKKIRMTMTTTNQRTMMTKKIIEMILTMFLIHES